VLAQDVDEPRADRVAEGFRDLGELLGLLALGVGVDDGLAARLAGCALRLSASLDALLFGASSRSMAIDTHRSLELMPVNG
jgi:hypothetical protein